MRTMILVVAISAALSSAIAVTAVETLGPRSADAANVQAVKDAKVIAVLKKVNSHLQDVSSAVGNTYTSGTMTYMLRHLQDEIGNTDSFDSTNYMLRRICEQTRPGGDIGTCVK